MGDACHQAAIDNLPDDLMNLLNGSIAGDTDDARRIPHGYLKVLFVDASVKHIRFVFKSLLVFGRVVAIAAPRARWSGESRARSGS